MSSRNAFLSPDARQRAVVLSQSLQTAQQIVSQGERDATCIIQRMSEMIAAAGGAIDYVALADPKTLQPVTQITGPVAALLAVKFGETRLIDNAVLTSDH
jgi:pantoate--beta-alanine ligase